MASAITCGRYPDCPRSQLPLAGEDNLNPERAEEALCPAQSASECAGTLWPAKPVGADLQKVGCASRPLRSVGHDLAHKGRHRIGVDDVLDRVAPVDGISGFEGTRGPKCALAGCGAKSAMRGNRWGRTCGKTCNPCAAASRSAPRMRGRASSNSRQSVFSGRRCLSDIAASVSRIARSARSARVMISSIPLRMTGRAAANRISS
jgi:hypothetical protein